MTSDRPTGDLILNAKYQESAADRKFAAEELVRSCVRKSDYETLMIMVNDIDFSYEARQDATLALIQVVSALCERGSLEPAMKAFSDVRIWYDHREKIGDAIVKACVREGTYEPLVLIIKDKNCPHKVLEDARHVLPDLVLKTGSLETIQQLAADNSLPNNTRQLFGMKLFEIHSIDDDLEGLLSLAMNKEAHDEPRKAASFKVFHFYEEAGSFSSMQAMVENASLLYEVRKSMALRIIDLCIESGNYPLLITMGQSSSVPMNIRIELEDKVDLAASKAVQNALSIGDRSVLSFMSHDDRLSDIIKMRAKAAVDKLERAQKGSNGHPQTGQELAARLARTLARDSHPPPSPRKISH
jgi:hypothetical protein